MGAWAQGAANAPVLGVSCHAPPHWALLCSHPGVGPFPFSAHTVTLAVMVERSNLDPIAEAQARVRLRYAKTKPVAPGPPTLGRLSKKITRKALPEKAAGLTRLQTQWSDIVGDQLSRLCYPEKIGRAPGGRQLTLRVVPAGAGLVQHQSEMIRQRVSVAAGGDIVRIKLTQGALPGSPGRTRVARGGDPTRADLTPEEYQELRNQCANIENAKLRAAIVALGVAMLTHPED